MRVHATIPALLLSLTLVACGTTDDDDPTDTDATTEDTTSGGNGGSGDNGGNGSDPDETGCVGGGSCSVFNRDSICQAAATFGFDCEIQSEEQCLFGYVFGTPADPGCSTLTNSTQCSAQSVGCRWDGTACVFKSCHSRSTESACTNEGCVWAEGACYYQDCATLSFDVCANSTGCQAREVFQNCVGTFRCDEAELPFPPPVGTTDEEICDGLGEASFPCTWVEP